MENARQIGNTSDDEDNSMYVSARENPEITIRLDQDRKRKITIISECEPAEKKGETSRRSSRSTSLRRQAIVNSAIRSHLSTASSCSRSRSRSRSRSVGRVRPASRDRSSGRKAIEFSDNRSAKDNGKLRLRLPTHLTERSAIGKKGAKAPDCLQLPSPLFILTEQQTVGASEKRAVQFVTKILLTTEKLSLEDRKKLYAEMVEAEYVGTSRSSADLREAEPEEEFEMKIYYSSKGVYIHTVQNVTKGRNGKSSTVSEQKNYANICKTKIIGDKGKSTDGCLNVSCSETVSVVNQLYTRSEEFKIGLKSWNVEGNVAISSKKTTFDPTKTTNFNEEIFFDNKDIGILIRHTASAEMKNMWEHEMGSFGEEQCEYHELRFYFDKRKPQDSSAASTKKSCTSTKSTKSPKSRSRSRTVRRRLTKNSATTGSPPQHRSPSTDTLSRSPDNSKSTSHRVMKMGEAKKGEQAECLWTPVPALTSTPKVAEKTADSVVLKSGAKPAKTPESAGRPRGAISIRQRSLSPGEVDLDKSLGSRKSAAKNLSQKIKADKSTKEEPRKTDTTAASLISKPTSPSIYGGFNTSSSSNNSTYMTASELHKARVSAASKPPLASPQGTLRVKETKVTREVRQEDGKPAEISEKTEKTVKEEKVKLRGRSKSPGTPTTKRVGDGERVVTLSAVKTTHESMQMTPIKVITNENGASPAKQTQFPEAGQLDMLIDNKRFVLNINFVLLAEKRPNVEIMGFSFRGQKLWEKSSDWDLSIDNSTSQTKTLARQASEFMENGEKKQE